MNDELAQNNNMIHLQKMGKRRKSGSVQYLLENAFRIGFLMVALLAFFLLISYYLNNKIDSRMLQAETLTGRLLYSDAIMLKDAKTQRIYAGIVDVSKFNDANIDSSISYTYTRHAAAKLKLYHKPLGAQDSAVYMNESYLNKKQFEKWKPLIDSGIKGRGSAVMVMKNYPVTCYDENMIYYPDKYYYCTLVIEIIVPNS